ncbi:MAG: hypothetical protein J2P58_02025 [Acidimicrobiaceae bacterium]|nr:hypothetical protein [Acidimicrobiaceae bacterium]
MGDVDAAVPDKLINFSGWADGQDQEFQRMAHRANQAIEAFNRKPQNPRYIGHLQPLGDTLAALGKSMSSVDQWVGQVGQAFAQIAEQGLPSQVIRGNQQEILSSLVTTNSETLAQVVGPSPTENDPPLHPPTKAELAERKAYWQSLTEQQRIALLKTNPAPYAYLATLAELNAAGFANLQQVYQQQAYKDAGINPANWNPSNGLLASEQNVQASYYFYQRLWDGDHNLEWAGMAKLAGAPIYAGLQDLYVVSQLPRDQLEALAAQGNALALLVIGYGVEDVNWYETQFLTMQKAIFDDLGVEHDAYEYGGVQAVQALLANDSGPVSQSTLKAWEQIDSGDPSQIAQGNEALLHREQLFILQPYYDALRNHNGPEGRMFSDILSENVASPVPGGEPFRDLGGASPPIGNVGPVQLGVDPNDVTVFPDRWQWITSNMYPQYQRLLQNPSAAQQVIDDPLSERAQNYRMVPVGIDGY